MRPTCGLAFIAATLAASTCAAAPYATSSLDKEQWSAVDLGSVRRSGDVVRAWAVVLLAQPLKVSATAPPIDESRYQVEVNCSQELSRTRPGAYYLRHEVIPSGETADWFGWKPVVPETSMSLLLSHLCDTRLLSGRERYATIEDMWSAYRAWLAQ